MNGSPVEVDGMRGIAVFHEEKVHIMVRRDKLPDSARNSPTVEALRDLRIALGPQRSGTRILAEAILAHHDVPLDSDKQVSLSVPEMVSQLHGGEVDAGFFVDAVPSEALRTILADDQIRLLSINRGRIAKMLGPALKISEIEPKTYPCQLANERGIETISTRALLVTTQELPFDFDVGKITKVLFEGADYLPMEEGAEPMVWDVSSIPLHPAALGYYQEAGYLPSPAEIKWLEATYFSLAILVILVGGTQGILKVRRDKIHNEVGRRVFEVSVTSSEPYSVKKLMEIRSEIGERVRKRWWQSDELDKSRWQITEGLIENRIRNAKT